MTYEKYLDYSREELLEKVRAVMSPKRFNHVLGVERAAIALAEKYGYDTEKAGLAGLLHDYAKELPNQEFLELTVFPYSAAATRRPPASWPPPKGTAPARPNCWA